MTMRAIDETATGDGKTWGASETKSVLRSWREEVRVTAVDDHRYSRRNECSDASGTSEGGMHAMNGGRDPFAQAKTPLRVL